MTTLRVLVKDDECDACGHYIGSHYQAIGCFGGAGCRCTKQGLASMDATWNAAIDAAAKVCEENAVQWGRAGYPESRAAAHDLAIRIRALVKP